MIRRLAAVLAFMAIGGALPVTRAPVHAASWYDGPCTDNVGITVVVDFQELGGGVNVRCAPGAPPTGLAALDNSGISWEGTQRFPGVVCRIAGKPGPDVEPCGNTPPANAYWSYWIAPRGGPWCYSTTGAGNRTPPPGTIEGWSFALTQNAVDIPPPGYDPPAPIPGGPPNPLKRSDCATSSAPTPTATTAAVTAPTPAPTIAIAQQDPLSTPTDAPQPAAEATTVPAVAAAGSPTSTTTAALPTVTTSTHTASTSTIEPSDGSATSSSTDDTRSADSVSSAPTTGSAVAFGAVDLGDDGRGDGGFGLATAIGIAVAASLGGAGAWAARRRRALT